MDINKKKELIILINKFNKLSNFQLIGDFILKETTDNNLDSKIDQIKFLIEKQKFFLKKKEITDLIVQYNNISFDKIDVKLTVSQIEEHKLDLNIKMMQYILQSIREKYKNPNEMLYTKDILDMLIVREKLESSIDLFKSYELNNIIRIKGVNFDTSKCLVYMLSNGYQISNTIMEYIVKVDDKKLFYKFFNVRNTSNDYGFSNLLIEAIKNGNRSFFNILKNLKYRIKLERWNLSFGSNKSYGEFTEDDVSGVLIQNE